MRTLKKLFIKNYKDEKSSSDELLDHEKSQLLKQVFGFFYLVFIIGLTLAVLMELKTEYQIDIFPGIDTPFDDVYRDAKNVFQGGEPPPPQP